VRRGDQHQTTTLAVLMGLCLASAGSGCCLALTGQGADCCDNDGRPAEAHPCLAGLKSLMWPWGHNPEPIYGQFHPVPCSPALTPRSELALGSGPPGLVVPPPAVYPPERFPASQPTPLGGVRSAVAPEPENIPAPAGSPPPAVKPPASGTGNQAPPQSGGTNDGAQATSATWIFRQPARPVSATDQSDGRLASGPDRAVR